MWFGENKRVVEPPGSAPVINSFVLTFRPSSLLSSLIYKQTMGNLYSRTVKQFNMVKFEDSTCTVSYDT